MRTWKNKIGLELPPGPWSAEPDKAQWVDETTGLDCLVVRNRLGALCGYVGIPTTHPWHGISYSHCTKGEHEDYCECSPESLTTVHGGLTYANSCQEDSDPGEGICHIPEPGRPDDVWWFGFDCSHFLDLNPRIDLDIVDPRARYRTFAYVQTQCALLAGQLVEVAA